MHKLLPHIFDKNGNCVVHSSPLPHSLSEKSHPLRWLFRVFYAFRRMHVPQICIFADTKQYVRKRKWATLLARRAKAHAVFSVVKGLCIFSVNNFPTQLLILPKTTYT